MSKSHDTKPILLSELRHVDFLFPEQLHHFFFLMSVVAIMRGSKGRDLNSRLVFFRNPMQERDEEIRSLTKSYSECEIQGQSVFAAFFFLFVRDLVYFTLFKGCIEKIQLVLFVVLENI